MNLKLDISDEELRALLGQRNDGPDAADQGDGSRSGNERPSDGGIDVGKANASGSGNVSGGSNDPAGASLPQRVEETRLPLHAADTQDGELLQALKEVVKTLTVRVASLEGEVGRLRTELAASRGEKASAEPRIVVEGVTQMALDAERETAPAAETAASARTSVHNAVPAAGETVSPTSNAPARLAWSTSPGGNMSSVEQGMTSRAERHRKPKKKSLFARIFD